MWEHQGMQDFPHSVSIHFETSFIIWIEGYMLLWYFLLALNAMYFFCACTLSIKFAIPCES